MKTVKVGSVGLGRLGYEHAKNLATQVPGCELAAICDVDASSCFAGASTFVAVVLSGNSDILS